MQNLSWKGDIPLNIQYDCVRDRSGKEKCKPFINGRYRSKEHCKKHCGRWLMAERLMEMW